MTAATFGWASAAEVSIETMRACANGLRSTRAVQHPGQLDVVEVGALAADEARVLLALQPAEADRPLVGARHPTSPARLLPRRGSCSAAQRIAPTMFL